MRQVGCKLDRTRAQHALLFWNIVLSRCSGCRVSVRSATHELSSWSPPLPRQILPSPIFYRSMHLAPQILFPPPSLFRCHASTGHHRFPHRLTISILTKIRPFVPYTCATFSYYLNTPSGMSYPNPYFTDTSIDHHPVTLVYVPSPPASGSTAKPAACCP